MRWAYDYTNVYNGLILESSMRRNGLEQRRCLFCALSCETPLCTSSSCLAKISKASDGSNQRPVSLTGAPASGCFHQGPFMDLQQLKYAPRIYIYIQSETQVLRLWPQRLQVSFLHFTLFLGIGIFQTSATPWWNVAAEIPHRG